MILTSSELAYLLLRRTPSVYSLTSQPFSARNCRQGTFLNFSAFFTLKFLTFFFRFFFSRFFVVSLYVRCVVVEYYSNTASTAQQSTKQQAKYVPIRVHVKRSTWYVRTCMQRPGCVPGAWNSRHLQVACLHPKCWTIYMCHSVPFFLVSERSGWNRLFAPKLLDHLAFCTWVVCWTISTFAPKLLDHLIFYESFFSNVTRQLMPCIYPGTQWWYPMVPVYDRTKSYVICRLPGIW